MYCSCYCSSRDCLQVVDTTERDRALAELDREREARRSAELEAAKVRMSQQLVLNECSQLRQELDRQRQQLELMRSVGFVRFLRVTPGLRELQPSRFFNWPASHHRTPQAGSSHRSFENISFSLRQDFLWVDVQQAVSNSICGRMTGTIYSCPCFRK